MASHWAKAHEGRAFWPRVGEATPPHPNNPLGLLAGPQPTIKKPFVSLPRVGPSRHFPLAAGPKSP